MKCRTDQGTKANEKRRGRAALLLEVVVAMAIMVGALGVLGAQLVSGLRATEAADLRTRAGALLERVLGLVEYDPELQDRLLTEERFENEFGDDLPGWFYEIEFKPIEEVAGLGQIRISVLYQSEDDARSGAGARLLSQTVLLKAARAKINLVEDFGLPADKLEEITALLPEGLDPTDFDPQRLIALAKADPQLIISLLPALVPLLQQYFGQGGGLPGDLQLPGGFSPQDLADLEEAAGALLGGGAGGGRGGAGVRPPPGGPPPGASTVTPRAGGRGRGGQSGAGIQSGGTRTGGGRSGRAPQPALRQGSGPGGQYTIEDLMRLREELQSQGGG
ncbi:MAG TPA: hypothetical protein PLU99_13715 [Phycisphaerae bacterium]|jgi:hypothetical protein|nr:hypothetical protein [Phycisphaerae bacterium]HRS26829.1 hypothetical protein [Phycisphaerae bacterium]